VRYQQPSDGQRGFFKLIELTQQLLAVFTKLLQRFIAVDKVTVRGDLKLHVRTTLTGHLLIIVLKYLAGVFLSVEEVLHISLRCLQLLHPGLKICKKLKGDVRLPQSTPQ
jgi:hypothetical protein